jgi:hypothetical protein
VAALLVVPALLVGRRRAPADGNPTMHAA